MKVPLCRNFFVYFVYFVVPLERKSKIKNLNSKITLTVAPELIPLFHPLLSKGFEVSIEEGIGIQAFLCGQIGLDPDYLEKRIQTVFLNGKAVDDFDSAILRPGSVLALSGALPGLAGATLRRGGIYGKMRGEISQSEKIEPAPRGEGRVTVKLFNLIVREVGPLFLEHGVLVDGEEFARTLLLDPDRFSAACKKSAIDNAPIDPSKLIDYDWKNKRLLLQVSVE